MRVWIWVLAFSAIALTGCVDAEETMSTRPDLTACSGSGSVSIPATDEEAGAAVECLVSSHAASEAIELEFTLVEDGAAYQALLQTLDGGAVNYFREYPRGGWGFHVQCADFQLPDGGFPGVDNCETEYVPAGN